MRVFKSHQSVILRARGGVATPRTLPSLTSVYAIQHGPFRGVKFGELTMGLSMQVWDTSQAMGLHRHPCSEVTLFLFKSVMDFD